MNSALDRSSESGVAFYYILIAIALLAALVFAVAQGGRTSTQTLSADRQKLLATEIIDYGAAVKNAVAQLRLRGVAVADISFATPELGTVYGVYGANPAQEVFNPAGGAIVFSPPNPDALASVVVAQNFGFGSADEINGIGTTCAAAECADTMLFLLPIKDEVCKKINDLLGVVNTGDLPPEGAGDVTFSSANIYSNTLGDADIPEVSGKNAGCFTSTANSANIFYQVVLPR